MGYWDTPGRSDEWFTPPHVFEALGETFDLDVAAPTDKRGLHVPTTRWLTAAYDNPTWDGFVWCNPPFGGRNAIAPWLEKFFDHGNGIALTPDRTSAPWFRDAWSRADAVMFTPKIRFLRPDGSVGKSPSNGTALWAAGDRAVAALERASLAGLGIVAKPVRLDGRAGQGRAGR
jgi:hypothetical protein